MQYTDETTKSVTYYHNGHGTHNALIADLDRAMAYFANATTNDIMWDLIEGQGYEIDYSDIDSRFGLLVAWCDNHGFSERGSDEEDRNRTWSYFAGAPSQKTWAAQTRAAQMWMGNIWVTHPFGGFHHEVTYSGVKQDETGHVYRECCGEHVDFEHSHLWSDNSVTWPDNDNMLAYCEECGHMTELSVDRISGYSSSR